MERLSHTRISNDIITASDSLRVKCEGYAETEVMTSGLTLDDPSICRVGDLTGRDHKLRMTTTLDSITEEQDWNVRLVSWLS